MASEDFGWDVAQYDQFADHRRRPALELLQRVRHPDPRVIHELGCGTGDIARLMAQRWPAAAVTGSDTSPEMLARARSTPSRVTWMTIDVATWQPEETQDVIYANAVLHWVGDHRALFPRLVDFLAPGGILAVQMPLSWAEPSHRGILDVLEALNLGSSALRNRYRSLPVPPPEWYVDLLGPLVSNLDVWTTRYYQVLTGADPIVEWVSGTGLRPVLDELAGDDRTAFLDAYREAMRVAYPPLPDRQTVYPFPRLFIVATR